MITLASIVLGVHLMSYHDAGNFNNRNYGLYVRHNEYVAGVYKNSNYKYTGYFGYVQKVGPIDVMFGAGGGYKKDGALTPMVIPSVAFPLGYKAKARVSFIPNIPKFTDANMLHLSVEYKF